MLFNENYAQDTHLAVGLSSQPDTIPHKGTIAGNGPPGESPMSVKDLIRAKLTESLEPTDLVVVDESHLHAGHSGSRDGGETHFRINIVSAAFAGKSRVERHRMVNDLLGEAFARGLHALAVRARAPGET